MLEKLRAVDAARVERFLRRKARQLGAEARARLDRSPVVEGALSPALTALPASALRATLDTRRWVALAEQHVAHVFDLLGSGPTLLDLRTPPPPPSRRARALLARLPTHYRSIDWHLDFKSNNRWDARTWHTRIRYDVGPGADVKVPWELGRLQHLPQLALARIASATGEPFGRELEAQLVDFVVHNPVGFGVNWACTMDVGIRAANIVMAYDLLAIAGHRLTVTDEAFWARTVHQHAAHIVGNLEWYPSFRSNHYLANVAGLLLAVLHLPSSPQRDAWHALAAQELLAEIALQFHPDGSNFEASTSYHRLSTEIAVYGLAALIRRSPSREVDGRHLPPNPPLAPSRETAAMAAVRVARALDFTTAVTKPSGLVAQIGDNDSGRFFRLDAGSAAGACVLDHQHLHGAGSGLFAAEPFGCEGVVVKALLSGEPLSRGEPYRPPAGSTTSTATHVTGAEKHYRFAAPADLTEGLEQRFFPDFGLCILRSPRVFAAVRAGTVGQQGLGGHAHEDQLSVELEIDGVPILRDPGTYLYTPDPVARRKYRSADAHPTPAHGAQPSPLFELRGMVEGRFVDATATRIVARQSEVTVEVRIEPDQVVVTTWNEVRSLLVHRTTVFSPAYGVGSPP